MLETSPRETKKARSTPKRGIMSNSKTKAKAKTKALAKRDAFPQRAESRRGMPSPGHRDLVRLYKHEIQGLSVEEIAALEKQAPFVIQASLDYVNEWKFRNQLSMLETKAISVAMKSLDGVGRVHEEGMKAEKVIYVDRETGEAKTAPDHAMRLKTVAEVRGLIETVQPRAPGIQLNQQFNNRMSLNGPGPGISFESLLRRKREQAGLTNSQEIEAVDVEAASGPTIEQEFAEFGGDEEDEAAE